MLYLVWDSEGIAETTDTVVEDLFEAAEGGSDSEGSGAKPAKKDKKSTKKSKKRDRSKSSSKSSSDGSSSSQSKVGLREFLCLFDQSIIVFCNYNAMFI